MNRNKYVFWGLVITTLISALDANIMQTASPTIVKQLGGMELFAWVFSVYMLASTITVPLYGKLSDMYGRKKLLMISVGLFTFGSILCGMANSMVMLIVFRGIQGLGAGGMVPLSMIIVGDLFTIERRGKIQAVFSSIWAISSVVGPILGSFFVEALTWRWIFFINIPIGIATVLCLIPYKETTEFRKAHIDYKGFFLFGISIALLLLSTNVSKPFWYLVIGFIGMLVFVLVERKEEQPFLPVSLFKNKGILRTNLFMLFYCLSFFGTSNFIPLFLQEGQHMSIYKSGLILLSIAAGWMFGSTPAGKWIIRFGYKPLFIVGSFITTISGLLLYLFINDISYLVLFLILTIQGVAFGLLFAVGTIASQEFAEAHIKGMSTSLQIFLRNIGTSVGVTIMGLLINQAANISIGMKNVFFYALLLSLVTVGISFIIPVKTAAAVGK
ncbi:major facilitator superfamily transporter [Bacillus sp. AFS076308]|uniref:MDR family MFS transporter n=1 Tax=unclassified Bacillus (in: firmicutes) TaxID=185979 RepID=UPI000BF2D752|nr:MULTISPECIES: MDR family MFS transporter [unclassified Bacillus (in: firmicutes)]PFN77612.1 major facilitator superfamily transporter [Bacillus sp. AFS076308]PGV45307.1 major facilitator superfamily transporter [Bacillus sp. AFS037270]